MENINRPISVPWDFTQTAMSAYEHAVNLAIILKKDIILLHIVRDVTDIDHSFEKLKAKTIELKNDFKVTTHPIIKTGNIFDTIRDVTQEYKAEMVVMGTHGVRGMQRFFGSNALKVVANSGSLSLCSIAKAVTRSY